MGHLGIPIGDKEDTMKRSVSLWFGIISLAVAVAFWAGPAAAGGGISGSLGVVPIGSGDAGRGSGSPQFDDVFDTGGILRIEPYYDFTRMVRGQLGLSAAKWPGTTFDGVMFDDLEMSAFYAGVKVRFLPGRPIRPYAGANLGFAHYGSVSVTGLHGRGVRSRYWGSTDTGYFDIGGGCEFLVSPKLSFFVDLRVMATGKPESVDPPSSDADGIGSVPFTAGVNFTF
jgi:hypothetical protein